MDRAGGMSVYIFHFRVKFTGTYFNTGLYFPLSFGLNFIGTSVSISVSECSHKFKNEFCHNVNTDLWIGTSL